MTIITRLFRQERGSAAVETAFLLPAFLAVILGICYFGLAFYAQNSIAYAAREGARYAVVRGGKSTTPATATDIINLTKSRVSGLLADQIDVSVVFSPNNMPGGDVTVTTTYALGPSATLLGIDALTFTRSARMTILQ